MRKSKGIGIRDIAAATNLNISTVSRALSNPAVLSPETVEYVRKTARTMGYLRGNSRKTILILLPHSNFSLGLYSVEIINALRKEAVQHDYLLEIFSSNQMELINEQNAFGIISFDFSNQLAKHMAKFNNLPMVCINDEPFHLEHIYQICSDEERAIRLAVSHLMSFGHRKIVMINQDSGTAFGNKSRIAAFNNICREFHLPPESECLKVSWEKTNSQYCFLHDAVAELLKKGVTAIISPGENNAPKLLYSLDFWNVKIPRDLSVITWEMPYFSRYGTPPLTTLEQNYPGIARAAFQLLEQLSQGASPLPCGDVAVEYLFHDRASVAAPRNT